MHTYIYIYTFILFQSRYLYQRREHMFQDTDLFQYLWIRCSVMWSRDSDGKKGRLGPEALPRRTQWHLCRLRSAQRQDETVSQHVVSCDILLYLVTISSKRKCHVKTPSIKNIPGEIGNIWYWLLWLNTAANIFCHVSNRPVTDGKYMQTWWNCPRVGMSNRQIWTMKMCEDWFQI